MRKTQFRKLKLFHQNMMLCKMHPKGYSSAMEQQKDLEDNLKHRLRKEKGDKIYNWVRQQQLKQAINDKVAVRLEKKRKAAEEAATTNKEDENEEIENKDTPYQMN